MKTTLRSLFACAAAGALAVSLAGCGPDDGQQSPSAQMALADGLAPGWSMMDLAGVDPAFYGDEEEPLPQALPMAASYDGGEGGYAPTYDYAPDDGGSYYEPLDDSYYYDDGYNDAYDEGSYDDAYDGAYDLDSDGNGYALLAVATALAGVLGDAPPDYGFGYDGVSPWAWETGDRYYRYAEPVHGGYRYYYYEPDAYRPFFVSDPYYSYGYRDDRVVAVYDRGGRRIDARRARLQLQAAKAYYARAERLHRAAQHDRRGVPAPLWARQRETIGRDRNDWIEKTAMRPGWQQWEARNAPKIQRQWASEALVRRNAERSFAKWQRADYRTPAPKFYTPQVRQEQARKVADLRRDHAKELADRRRERVEKQREVRQEAQRTAQRTERAAPRGAQQVDVRERIERQQAARQLARNDRRAPVSARAANRTPERAAPKPQPARAAIAARREERKAAQAQRAANRAVIARKAEAPKARHQAAPAARRSVVRPAAAPERTAPAPRLERQQQAQQRQKAQQEAKAERARQAAARQQERSARREQAKASAERQQDRASRQVSVDPARQAIAQRREEQARQRQTQAEQRQREQAAARQQAQTVQRQQAQAEQRQAPARQRVAEAQQGQQQQAAERQQARQDRQNARDQRREARKPQRGDRS